MHRSLPPHLPPLRASIATFVARLPRDPPSQKPPWCPTVARLATIVARLHRRDPPSRLASIATAVARLRPSITDVAKPPSRPSVATSFFVTLRHESQLRDLRRHASTVHHGRRQASFEHTRQSTLSAPSAILWLPPPSSSPPPISLPPCHFWPPGSPCRQIPSKASPCAMSNFQGWHLLPCPCPSTLWPSLLCPRAQQLLLSQPYWQPDLHGSLSNK